jgi:hypothetical protein
LLDGLVLLFRGQNLTDAFRKRFGDLDWALVEEGGGGFVQGHPQIYVVSDVIEKRVPMGSLPAAEAI